MPSALLLPRLFSITDQACTAAGSNNRIKVLKKLPISLQNK